VRLPIHLSSLTNDRYSEFSMKRESFQGGGGMPELCFSDSDFDRIPDCRYVSMLMHMHVYLHVDLFVLHLSLE
jgi:hypothetical protein